MLLIAIVAVSLVYVLPLLPLIRKYARAHYIESEKWWDRVSNLDRRYWPNRKPSPSKSLWVAVWWALMWPAELAFTTVEKTWKNLANSAVAPTKREVKEKKLANLYEETDKLERDLKVGKYKEKDQDEAVQA